MNIQDRISSKKAISQNFPNITTVGYMDFFTQTVHLPTFDSDKISDLYNNAVIKNLSQEIENSEPLSYEAYQFLTAVRPLAAHEYTHFLDCISTVWGLHFLLKLYNAYATNPDVFYNTNENNYYQVVKAMDEVRMLRLPKYYTTLFHVSNTFPWTYSFTVGRLFSKYGAVSDCPIAFVRFYNKMDELLCRVPISLVSILESSSIAHELIFRVVLASQLNNEDKEKELKKITDYYYQTIYDPNFTEYSVAAHLASHSSGFDNILSAYCLCLFLSRLALNFPTSLFSKINVPDGFINSFDAPLKIRSKLKRDFSLGLQKCDRSLLFYILSLMVRPVEFSIYDMTPLISEIFDVLKKINIDANIMIKMAAKEIGEIVTQIKNLPFNNLHKIADAGQSNFSKINLFENPIYDFNELDIPPVLLRDGSMFHPFEKKSETMFDFNSIEHFKEIYRHVDWVERFYEGCIA